MNTLTPIKFALGFSASFLLLPTASSAFFCNLFCGESEKLASRIEALTHENQLISTEKSACEVGLHSEVSRALELFAEVSTLRNEVTELKNRILDQDNLLDIKTENIKELEVYKERYNYLISGIKTLFGALPREDLIAVLSMLSDPENQSNEEVDIVVEEADFADVEINASSEEEVESEAMFEEADIF